jgi:hypothetical protein
MNNVTSMRWCGVRKTLLLFRDIIFFRLDQSLGTLADDPSMVAMQRQSGVIDYAKTEVAHLAATTKSAQPISIVGSCY